MSWFWIQIPFLESTPFACVWWSLWISQLFGPCAQSTPLQLAVCSRFVFASASIVIVIMNSLVCGTKSCRWSCIDIPFDIRFSPIVSPERAKLHFYIFLARACVVSALRSLLFSRLSHFYRLLCTAMRLRRWNNFASEGFGARSPWRFFVYVALDCCIVSKKIHSFEQYWKSFFLRHSEFSARSRAHFMSCESERVSARNFNARRRPNISIRNDKKFNTHFPLYAVCIGGERETRCKQVSISSRHRHRSVHFHIMKLDNLANEMRVIRMRATKKEISANAAYIRYHPVQVRKCRVNESQSTWQRTRASIHTHTHSRERSHTAFSFECRCGNSSDVTWLHVRRIAHSVVHNESHCCSAVIRCECVCATIPFLLWWSRWFECKVCDETSMCVLQPLRRCYE